MYTTRKHKFRILVHNNLLGNPSCIYCPFVTPRAHVQQG